MTQENFLKQVKKFDKNYSDYEDLMYVVTLDTVLHYFVDNINKYSELFEVEDLIDFVETFENFSIENQYFDLDCDELSEVLIQFVEKFNITKFINLLKTTNYYKSNEFIDFLEIYLEINRV